MFTKRLNDSRKADGTTPQNCSDFAAAAGRAGGGNWEEIVNCL